VARALRLEPLPPSEWSDYQRELIELTTTGGPGGTASNIYTTLARNPGLLRHLASWGGKLQRGGLSGRERELAIMRTAWRCECEYEWAQHLPIAAAVGITDDEVTRITAEIRESDWETTEAALLRAVDELHDDNVVSDRTWESLSSRFDAARLIELLFLIGNYHMIAYVLNSLGVEIEPGLTGFPDTDGSQ
jgi:alkylhydroperoxidase family enzyme